MASRLRTLLSAALLSIVPLSFWGRCEDVFFLPWRAALGVFIAACLAAMAVETLAGGRKVRFHSALVPWAALAAWALASCVISRNPADSLRRALELAGCIAGAGAGFAAAGRASFLVVSVLWTVSIISLYGLLQSAGLDPLPWTMKFGARAFGTLGNPDYFAGHLLLTLPLGLAVWMRSRGGAWLAALALVLMAAGFGMAQVRGAWLAAAAAAAWAAFWIKRGGALPREEQSRLKLAGAAAAAIALVFILASGSIRNRVASVFHFSGYDATGRRYLWQVAGEIWSQRPLVGFGVGSYKFEFPRFQHSGARLGLPQFLPYNYSEHAHNEILQFGAELGLAGVGLFLLGILAWFRWWRRSLEFLKKQGAREKWWLQIGLGTSVFGCFAYSFVNFPLQIVPTAVLWFFLIGLSLALPGSEAGVRSVPRRLWPAAVLLPALLGLAAVSIFTADLVGNVYMKELRGRLMQGDLRRAAVAGERGEKLIGWDYHLYRLITRLGIAAGNESLAERGISARLRLHPFFAEPLADRAELSETLGRPGEARRRYEKLLETSPNFAAAWGALGRMSFGEGDYRGSVGYFRKALEYQPGNPVWEHNLASAYGMLKMYKEAMEADIRAVESDPGFVDAYVGLALSARALNLESRAREAAQKAYLLDPGNLRVRALIRQLY